MMCDLLPTEGRSLSLAVHPSGRWAERTWASATCSHWPSSRRGR